MKRSSGEFITTEQYGVTDIDGTVIPSARAMRGSPVCWPISPVSYDGA